MRKNFSLFFAILIVSMLFVPALSHAIVTSGPSGPDPLAPGASSPGVSCPTPPENFKGVLCIIFNLLVQLVPLLVSVAFLVFFWGLVKFVYNAGNEKVREEAKNIMFWGVIALFVMVSIWGIINFFAGDIFGVSYIGIPKLPVFSE